MSDSFQSLAEPQRMTKDIRRLQRLFCAMLLAKIPILILSKNPRDCISTSPALSFTRINTTSHLSQSDNLSGIAIAAEQYANASTDFKNNRAVAASL